MAHKRLKWLTHLPSGRGKGDKHHYHHDHDQHDDDEDHIMTVMTDKALRREYLGAYENTKTN